MAIKTGERMPSGTLKTMGPDGAKDVKTDELFRGKKVVLFSVPGAFTPTCDAKHLPVFVQLADQMKGKGVGTVLMLADGNGDYSRALGLELDARGFGLGMRGQRFAILVNDGVATKVNI